MRTFARPSIRQSSVRLSRALQWLAESGGTDKQIDGQTDKRIEGQTKLPIDR